MVVCCFVSLFFVKQKTAYEMRISDWSSDVCSSDLTLPGTIVFMFQPGEEGHHGARFMIEDGLLDDPAPDAAFAPDGARSRPTSTMSADSQSPPWAGRARSEEHTSELQSLMSISYAVFCLNKKHHQIQQAHYR